MCTSDEVFEFSRALDLLKHGSRVCRKGWKGKGMFILLVSLEDYSVPGIPAVTGTNNPSYWRKQPWIALKTADNGFVPWVASQSDLLADDWSVFVQ